MLTGLVAKRLPVPFGTMRPKHIQAQQHRWQTLRHAPNPAAGHLQKAGIVKSTESEVYEGMFGPWQIEESDKLEVFAYRTGLQTFAVCLILSSMTAFLPEGASAQLRQFLDPLTLIGFGGLGVSLYTIHIYVTPLKRFVQALYAAGVLAIIKIMLDQDISAVEYVVQHPQSMWGVGLAFAAITGIAFKEGLCYAKLEAFLLVLVIPTLMLGHLSQGIPEEGLKVLLLLFNTLYGIFAARKFTQAVKDDIGDKSVFEYMKLPEEEQQELVRKLKKDNPFQ